MKGGWRSTLEVPKEGEAADDRDEQERQVGYERIASHKKNGPEEDAHSPAHNSKRWFSPMHRRSKDSPAHIKDHAAHKRHAHRENRG